jgi:hypothetical protein
VRVRRIKLKPANAFVDLHHRHNDPTRGHIFSLAAEHEGVIVGVAIVGRPVNRHLDNGLIGEVLRCCVVDRAPKGCNSFLYGAARRAAAALGFDRLITYTLRSESGASLRGAGWSEEATVSAKAWNCNSRPREAGTVDDQQKIRWGVAV